MVNYSNYWAPSSKIDTRQQELIPKSADIVVVGGGVAGLLTIKKLLDAGIHSCVLLEESNLGSHSSSRSNGFIQFKTCKYFHELKDEATAKEYFNFIHYNNSCFLDFIKNLDIHCELDVMGGLEVALTEEQYHKLQLEDVFLKSLNLAFDPVLLNHNQISKITPNDHYMGGMFMPLQATFNPQRLISALYDSLGTRKNKIYVNSFVEKVEEDVDGSLFVFIRNSGLIKAKKVVYCTDAYTPQLLPEFKKHITASRGISIVTSEMNLAPMLSYPLTLEFGKESIRTHGNRILYSSLKQPTKGKTKAHASYFDRQISSSALEKAKIEMCYKIQKPSLSIEYAWSSVSSETSDGIPLIGEYKQNQYMLVGFNGYGLSHVYGGSSIITDMIIKDNSQIPGTKIFDPKRLGV